MTILLFLAAAAAQPSPAVQTPVAAATRSWPIREGDVLTAAAEQEGSTNRLAFYRVVVRRGDADVVALFRGTVYKTNKPFFQDPE